MREKSRGERMREARERTGLNQPEVAAALGFTEQTVRRWEKDKALPTGPVYVRLAHMYGLPNCRWFETGEGPGPIAYKRALDAFLASPDGNVPEDLVQWLRHVPPPEGADVSHGYFRSLASAWYAGIRDPGQASDAAFLAQTAGRARKKRAT